MKRDDPIPGAPKTFGNLSNMNTLLGQDAIERLAAIVIGSDDAIIGKNVDRVITSWNHGAEIIFGYSAEEAIGQSIDMLIPPGSAPEEMQIYLKILKGERVSHFRTTRLCKDGRTITISATISPIFDSNGVVIGSSKIARDITHQVSEEQALAIANKKLSYEADEKAKRAAELLIANDELVIANQEKANRASELALANEELAFQNSEKAKRVDELVLANEEKAKRAAELVIANKELIFQNDEKIKRVDELVIASQEKANRAAELALANEELAYQNEEKAKRVDELLIANEEKAKRAAELVVANDELAFQNNEKLKRVDELVVANQDKANRAAELAVANDELAFQNNEKEKRVTELLVANTEKAKRAAELAVANEELYFQNNEKARRVDELTFANEEKAKRAAELAIANEELTYQNTEKAKRVNELTSANEEKLKRAAELIMANEKLKESLMETIGLARQLTELRDPYTSGHEQHVGDLAKAIAQELGFDMVRQEGLRIAGYLHDIGKIIVPVEILCKPGKITSEEYGLVKNHVQAGFDLLDVVTFPWPISRPVLEHHERLDGSGYPHALSGDQISIEGCILAVADVVDAISSHRPYRAALGIENALAEIERGQGSLYDSSVVQACLRLFREKHYVIKTLFR